MNFQSDWNKNLQLSTRKESRNPSKVQQSANNLTGMFWFYENKLHTLFFATTVPLKSISVFAMILPLMNHSSKAAVWPWQNSSDSFENPGWFDLVFFLW